MKLKITWVKYALPKSTLIAVIFKQNDLFQKKKKTSDDENLHQVLRENIAIREERERKQKSDSRLLMLSLLEDFKNIPKHRKLCTKMELIEVIQRAQMPSVKSLSEFGLFRQHYACSGFSLDSLYRVVTQ